MTLLFPYLAQNPYLLFDSRFVCRFDAHIASSSASLDSARMDKYEIWCFLLDKAVGP